MLRDTKLAVSCDAQILFQIQRLGETLELPAQHILFRSGDAPDYMYLVVSGEVHILGGSQAFVIGAGDFFGEVGFFAGTGRTRDCMVGADGARVWRIRRDLLYEQLDTETTILFAHFLLALAPHIHVRLLTAAGGEEDGIRYNVNEQSYQVTFDCDHQHRAILCLEPHLRRKTAWATAGAVWNFVSHLPFRFGFAQTRASQTLKVGFGTQTTKANLQVALFRALGMRAGFTRLLVPSTFYDPLKPPGLRGRGNSDLPIEHDFCVVYLDDQWVACDATFSKEALQLLSEADPRYQSLIWSDFESGHGFSLEQVLGSQAPWYVTEELTSVVPNLDPGYLEAMNIQLDKVQGAIYHVPVWMHGAQSLLLHNPRIAYQKVFANIICDLDSFLKLIHKEDAEEFHTLIL